MNEIDGLPVVADRANAIDQHEKCFAVLGLGGTRPNPLDSPAFSGYVQHMLNVLPYCLWIMASGAGGAELPPWFPPGTPPAPALDVVQMSGATADDKLTMTTLQGLVNRGSESRLWLHLGAWDQFWLARLVDKGYIHGSSELTMDQALEKYSPQYRKVIVYDPAVSASINIGTMLGSLEDGIVVSPDRAASPALVNKAVEDLRGRWKTQVEAYRWAFESLWPRMHEGVLACYHPTVTQHHLRDYLVRNRIFHFWVTSPEKADGIVSNHEQEMAFLRDLLAKTPSGIPVLGFWFSGEDRGVDEYAGVGLAGEFGKITVVCDWATNLSLLSGVRADLERAVRAYQQRVDRTPPTLEPGKIYIAYDIVESGDSPSYVETRQPEVWKDPKRGSLPINWSLGPAVLDLAPPVAEYYYETATPKDYLYMSISGAGYCHPYRNLMRLSPAPEAAWTAYLDRTAQYLRRMGCQEIGLYTDAWKPYDRQAQDPVTLRFLLGIPGVKMLVLGMGRDEGMNATNGNYLLGQSPALVSHILTRWPTDYISKTREENIQWLVDDIRAQTPAPRPAFMQVMALSWAYAPSEIADVQQRLGEEYVPVTLPVFAGLYRAAMT